MEKPVSLILGVGQTVGEAVAMRFMNAGHNILAVDPDEDQIAQISKVAGDKIETHHGDIHSKIGLKNALSLCLETHGRIDNIICIPRLPEPDYLLQDDPPKEGDVAQLIKSALNTIRIFGKYMKDRPIEQGATVERTRQTGTFTFILSLASLTSQAGWLSEGVAQKAILGTVKTASVELSAYQIRINAIAALRPRAEGREPWLLKRTPLKRAAIGEEIAETALFLSSTASSIITGEVIVLDGGRQNLSGLVDED